MSSNILLSDDDKVRDNHSRLIETQYVSIDVAMLYDVSGNDMSFIRSAVNAFLKKMPDILKKIEDSLKIQDWDSVYKLSHSVRSSISIIKIDELLDWVTQMEVNAKNGTSLNSMNDLLKKIREKYELAEVILIERFKV